MQGSLDKFKVNGHYLKKNQLIFLYFNIIALEHLKRVAKRIVRHPTSNYRELSKTMEFDVSIKRTQKILKPAEHRKNSQPS